MKKLTALLAVVAVIAIVFAVMFGVQKGTLQGDLDAAKTAAKTAADEAAAKLAEVEAAAKTAADEAAAKLTEAQTAAQAAADEAAAKLADAQAAAQAAAQTAADETAAKVAEIEAAAQAAAEAAAAQLAEAQAAAQAAADQAAAKLDAVKAMSAPALAEYYKNKTVILHSNDVHGAMGGYACITGLKNLYTGYGAQVILADAGDFSQGTIYVSTNKGKMAVDVMNSVGYDVVTLGNHEFDYGYAQLMENLKDAKFQTICANVILDATGEPILPAYTIIEKGGVKIGFFGMETPETATKVNPGLISEIHFTTFNDLYACAQNAVNALKAEGADIVIGLVHLGVIEIDNDTKKIVANYLVPAAAIDKDPAVEAEVKAACDKIDAEFGAVFAHTAVLLDGNRDPGNRTQETNLGDLITDAMVWSVVSKGGVAEDQLMNVVGITNGGGIRATIQAGDISMKDINTVLPFGNTVAVIYVKGTELLEALEASTFCTPKAIGGYPQTSGIKWNINTAAEYDQGAIYVDASGKETTYYAPASIKRVTIESVNGQPFNPDGVYVVVTNNFCAAGGDTYNVFMRAYNDQDHPGFDTGIPMDEAVMDYIYTELGAEIGDKYAAPRGDQTQVTEPAAEVAPAA